MKKLALLVVLALTLSFSCVFATDLLTLESSEKVDLIAENLEAVSGDEIVLSEETDTIAEEDANVPDIDISGETENEIVDDSTINEVENVDEPTTNTNVNAESSTDTTDVRTSNNSATIGAIIAIVIVVAVVAIAAILRKD